MKELILIQTELKAPKNQTNSFGGYKYRSCEDIVEALKPILLKHNCYLNISDEICLIGDRYYVKATAKIANSENQVVSVTSYAREPEVKKGMDEAQITGATSSYARKYALNGLLAIDDTKDADATNKHETQEKPKTEPIKQVEPKPIAEPSLPKEVAPQPKIDNPVKYNAAEGCWFGKNEGKLWMNMDKGQQQWYFNYFSKRPKKTDDEKLAIDTLARLLTGGE